MAPFKIPSSDGKVTFTGPQDRAGEVYDLARFHEAAMESSVTHQGAFREIRSIALRRRNADLTTNSATVRQRSLDRPVLQVNIKPNLRHSGNARWDLASKMFVMDLSTTAGFVTPGMGSIANQDKNVTDLPMARATILIEMQNLKSNESFNEIDDNINKLTKQEYIERTEMIEYKSIQEAGVAKTEIALGPHARLVENVNLEGFSSFIDYFNFSNESRHTDQYADYYEKEVNRAV